MSNGVGSYPFGQYKYSNRNADIWRKWTEGRTFRSLAEEYGISRERCRQIVERSEDRVCRMLSRGLLQVALDPIAYNVWHTFTHEGRITRSSAPRHKMRFDK